jgi:hypothetical protein
MKTEARAIEDLILDPRCQAREHFDDEVIEAYREAYADGVELPPIEVVDVGGELLAVDGFHRISGALKAGHEFIRVHIVEKAEDVERAQWIALSKNCKHGLRRTSRDKRKVVRLALENGIGQEQSSRTIADHVGVHHSTVQRIRAEWEAEQGALAKSDNAPATVTTKDGRQYPRKRVERDDESTDNGGVQPERKPKKAKPSPFEAFRKNVKHVGRDVPKFYEHGSQVHEAAQRFVMLVRENEPDVAEVM